MNMQEWNRRTHFPWGGKRDNEILLYKSVPSDTDIELDRNDLDGAHIIFDDVPDRNILVAESGQTYILNEAVGRVQRGEFSVHPVSIAITARTVRMYHPASGGWTPHSERTVRVKVTFPSGEDSLGNLLFGTSMNEGRRANMHHYYNLDYKVRPRIEDVEEFGE
jgi:hypothetical protein